MSQQSEIIKHNINYYKLSKKINVIDTINQEIIVSHPPYGVKEYM